MKTGLAALLAVALLAVALLAVAVGACGPSADGPPTPAASASAEGDSTRAASTKALGTYTNERFGFTLSVPPGLVRQPTSRGADGQGFASPDGRTTLVVYGYDDVLREGVDGLAARARTRLQTVESEAASPGTVDVRGRSADGTVAIRGLIGPRVGALAVFRWPAGDAEAEALWDERIVPSFRWRTDALDADWTVEDVERPATGPGPFTLRTVRAGVHPEPDPPFDRVVFAFDGEGLPSAAVAYVDAPVYACGSGAVVDVPGENRLQIRLRPARGHSESGTALAPRSLPAVGGLLAVERVCDFEAEVVYVVGVGPPSPFRLRALSAPPRLVLDIARPVAHGGG